jgi:hypothetical protein
MVIHGAQLLFQSSRCFWLCFVEFFYFIKEITFIFLFFLYCFQISLMVPTNQQLPSSADAPPVTHLPPRLPPPAVAPANRRRPASHLYYSKGELLHFLRIMHKHMPISGDEWEPVLKEHSLPYPGRDVESGLSQGFVHDKEVLSLSREHDDRKKNTNTGELLKNVLKNCMRRKSVRGERKHLQPMLQEIEFKIRFCFLGFRGHRLWLRKYLRNLCISFNTQKRRIIFCAFLYPGRDPLQHMWVFVSKPCLFMGIVSGP